MPIEIRELIIQAKLAEDEKSDEAKTELVITDDLEAFRLKLITDMASGNGPNAEHFRHANRRRYDR